MTLEQGFVFGVLLLTLILFVWSKWRYDIVALLALRLVGVSGVMPAEQTFAGFGHPAVVTVAAVLVASRGLQNSGLVDQITKWLAGASRGASAQIAALSGLVAAFSGFMNNIGALAILMPAAIRLAHKHGRSPSLLLMPLAFSSLLGGMITLIGTPPNIIVSAFRAEVAGAPFQMFDFAPVGLGVTVAGILFIALVGWRLIPQRKGQASPEKLFEIQDYLTEVLVPLDSPLVGKALRDLRTVADADVTVVGLVRGGRRRLAPTAFEVVRHDDILIIEADSTNLKELVDAAGLRLAESKQIGAEAIGSEEVSVIEAVIMPGSAMEYKTASSLNLRRNYGINLLAAARQGARLRAQLSRIQFRAGDVLLLQGRLDTVQEVLPSLGCLPLAERRLKLGQPRRVLLALGIFGAALGTAAFGLLPVQVAFTAAAVIMVLAGLISLREAYASVDWPILILLGAMIPVGQALEATGGAQLIAHGLLALAGRMPAAATLALVLIGTMFLSDLVNNAAAAVLMAPIAIRVALGLSASPDPFLIAVAVGASCAFLTPIGHQSNTLVMGPGGYRFSDYWRMGLPLEVIIVIVAMPLLLWFWPLYP
jgi:di/tricarboxylate transporter